MATETTSITYYPLIRRFALVGIILTILWSGCQNSSQNTPLSSTSVNGPFYEVYLPHWAHKEAIKELTSHVFRLRNLAVKTIIISPVQPVSQLMQLGDLGSPFAIQNHGQVRSLLGDALALQALIDTVHKYDMRILMDWYPAVAGRDHVWKTYAHEIEADTLCFNPYALPLRDVIAWDYSQEGLEDSMMNTMALWVKKFGLDGFRVFHDSIVPTDLYSQLQKETGCALLNAGQPSAFSGFDYHMDSNYTSACRDLVDGKINAQEFVAECLSGPNEDLDRQHVNYITNYILQSKEGSVPQLMGSAYRSLFIAGLWTGQDVLMPGGLEIPLTKNMTMVQHQVIKWSDQMDDDFYRQLFILKNRNRALHAKSGVTIKIIESDNPEILAIERTHNSHKAILILNTSNQVKECSFKENIFNLNDYVTQRPVSIRKDSKLKVGPYQYYVLTNV